MAKVSVMSVSMVVNGKAGRLSAATRERVEHAVATLRYRPNATARSLRLARGTAIAMIVVDASPTFLAAPFTTQLVAGLSNRLSESGQPVTLQGLPPDQASRALALRYIGADGLCLLTAGSNAERQALLDNLVTLGLPFVLFQETLAPGSSDTCLIRQDDRGGGRMIAGHVIAAGARRLVMLVPEQVWPSMSERRAGVEEEVARHDGVTLSVLSCGNEGLDATRAALGRYVEARGLPDAVLAGNDRMATAAVFEIRARGLAIPRQIMVTGFNGFPPRDAVDPLLTTIRSAAYEMGVAGAELLLARLARGTFPRAEIVLPVTFLAGTSTRHPEEVPRGGIPVLVPPTRRAPCA